MPGYAPTPAPAVDRGRLGDDTLFSSPWFSDFELRDELRRKRMEAARPAGVPLKTVSLMVLAGIGMTPLAAFVGALAAVMVTLYR